MRRFILALILAWMTGAVEAQSIFLSPAEIASLPVTGKAWDAMKAAADKSPTTPNLSNQDENENCRTLARALVWARTGAASYKTKVLTTLGQLPGTEDGGRTLALGRKLGSYLLAADLVGYRPTEFVSWVRSVRDETLDGSTLRKKSETKMNNWNSSCMWSRTIAAIYLNDTTDYARCLQIYRFTLGDRTSGFIPSNSAFGCMDWQPDSSKPCVIVAPGVIKNGHTMDGCLPEEMRRWDEGECDPFEYPFPPGNYPWSALEGLLGTGWIFWHNGHPEVIDLQSKALARAVAWQYVQANNPAEGNDTHLVPVVNAFYATTYAVASPTQHGKIWGFGDWFSSVVVQPTPPPVDIAIKATWNVTKPAGATQWTADRLEAEGDVLGHGATSEAAIQDWLERNDL